MLLKYLLVGTLYTSWFLCGPKCSQWKLMATYDRNRKIVCDNVYRTYENYVFYLGSSIF